MKKLAQGALWGLVALLVNTVPAMAAIGLGGQDTSGLSGGQSSGDISQDIQNIINYFLGFIGLLAVIMMIWGGFLYITAGGDDEKTGKGRKFIINAVIGIVIILLAYSIVNTILSALG